MREVWLHFYGQGAVLPRNAVADRLSAVGIEPRALDLDAPSGTGLLFFDRVTPELMDLVRELSGFGLRRLLAIAVSAPLMAGDDAWLLLRNGASDVFFWDHSPEPAAEIAARLERWRAVDELVESPLVQQRLVGRSPEWVRVLRQVIEAARFTDASILISGESGTGKEVVAGTIHALDGRPDRRDFVVLDCTTVVPELAGSEFFGHERGAFTGAVNSREGAFALADGGTLFLDEVGELPLALQAELLRVVQEGSYKRLGSNVWRHTRFRLVCATNRDLRQEEAAGKFRRDFYFRIAGWMCHLPPLRERPDDVLALVTHVLRQLFPQDRVPELDEGVRRYLVQRPYPGNVRDLRRLVLQIAGRHVGPGPITVGDIPEEERPASDAAPIAWRDAQFEHAIRRAVSLGAGLKDITGAAAETAIRVAVGDEDGNLQRAARRLGVTDRALQMRRLNSRLRSQVAGSQQTG